MTKLRICCVSHSTVSPPDALPAPLFTDSVEPGLRVSRKCKGELYDVPIGATRFDDTPGERDVGL